MLAVLEGKKLVEELRVESPWEVEEVAEVTGLAVAVARSFSRGSPCWPAAPL
jgi:hypothetical protein